GIRQAMSFRCLLEIKDLVNFGCQFLIFHQVKDMPDLRLGSPMSAMQGNMFTEKFDHIHVHDFARVGATDRHAPANSESLDALQQNIPSHTFNHGIHTTTIGQFEYSFGQPPIAIIDGLIGAKATCTIQLFIASSAGYHTATRQIGNLYSRGADTPTSSIY